MDNFNKETWLNPTGRIKIYKYRIRLDVYEDIDEPIKDFKEPIQRFAIDTISLTNNKDSINIALKLNFEKLLNFFNAEIYGDKGAKQ